MQLEEKELTLLRSLNEKFQNIKLQLGEIEIQKGSLLTQVPTLRSEFENLEKELVKKYGSDTSINLETGLITKK